MNNVWFQSALWMALALVAATASLYITISAALFEIVVGAIAGLPSKVNSDCKLRCPQAFAVALCF